MNPFDDQRLTALLDFTDEAVPLDLAAITRTGRRRRHHKRAAIAGASAVTLAAAGGLGAELVRGPAGSERRGAVVTVPGGSPSSTSTPGRSLPATVTQSDDLIADYPPSRGSTTTIASNADGWRAVAYVTVSGELCFGSIEPSGATHGACAPTGRFGNGPIVNNATGPGITPAATAPASDAPSADEIGLFGTVTTAATEASTIQHVARVTVEAGDSSINATLSPTAASMGSTTALAGDERVWFAWVPADVAGGALTVSSYTAAGDVTGSQPLWLTPHD